MERIEWQLDQIRGLILMIVVFFGLFLVAVILSIIGVG